MKRKGKLFPDEAALNIATEYLRTDISLRELQEKYRFTGKETLYNYIRKFGLLYSNDTEQKVSKETIKNHV